MTRWMQIGLLCMAAGLTGIALPWPEPAAAGACSINAPYLLVLSVGAETGLAATANQTPFSNLASRTGNNTVALGGQELICRQQISLGFVSGGLGCTSNARCAAN